MPQDSKKQQRKKKIQEEIVKILARKHGVGTRYVQMVIKDDKDSPEILADYIEYKQGENLLLKAVEKSVPFTVLVHDSQPQTVLN